MSLSNHTTTTSNQYSPQKGRYGVTGTEVKQNPPLVPGEFERLKNIYSKAVCKIKCSEKGGEGTGYLIGRKLVLTNHHVISSNKVCWKYRALFFYDGSKKTLEFKFDTTKETGFFYTSPSPDEDGKNSLTKDHLDFTILALKDNGSLNQLNGIAFNIFHSIAPLMNSRVLIVQHPLRMEDHTSGNRNSQQRYSEGNILDPEKHILVNNSNTPHLKNPRNLAIHYSAGTASGSSGGAVIDNAGNILALHRMWCISNHCNIGIRIDAIARHLRNKKEKEKIILFDLDDAELVQRILYPKYINDYTTVRLKKLNPCFTKSSLSRLAVSVHGVVGDSSLLAV